MKPTFTSVVLAALVIAAAGSAAAHGPAGHEEDIKVVQSRALPEAPGKQAIVLTVHYKPGTKSAAHTHPGSVFAYVLEGEVVSQLDGEAPVTYCAGQSWYEAPGARHLVSRNASETKPATLLVWMIKADNEAPVLPLPSGAQK
jgi:quercetin dioxygenase-like cupin family protein